MNTREFWLLRHARAELHSQDGRDRSRQLHAAGRRACASLNHWLKSCGMALPEQVLVSPAVRTRETADLALAGLDLNIQVDQRLWLASADDLLAIAASSLQSCQRLMLIGHNPGLEDLVHHLGGRLPVTGLKPATLVVLSLALPLTAGQARTLQLLEASEST
ncbi:MAG: hypothetical protein EA370_02660 [Wenzhouxiangella sp.]|nr:MAG: hypothetical protein EA370_02660 [Wenzhouxiangella sp.]